MPRGDHTGPEGLGPGTGRRMGYCAGYEMPGFVTAPRYGGRGPGAGFGLRRRGRGLGRGYGPSYARRGVAPGYHGKEMPMAPENRKAVLQEEIDAIDQEMEQLAKEKEFLEKERNAAESGE